ncbi:helix-turn-helix transcriptional regulator [Frateuria aurantia]
MSDAATTSLGQFLRERRTRLDPASFGLGLGRRRTPGLRREEVAQRAHISATWYTWLEQNRGGAPSSDVLQRLAGALMLTELEREHMFILALGHPPEPRYQQPDTVSPRLQRVLDAMPDSPAMMRTATWDVVAWNRAASLVLTDYGKLPPRQRNILRLLFSDTRIQAAQDDWLKVARYVVGAFRADAARAGAEVGELVEDLRQSSPQFDALWRNHDVIGHGDGLKRLHHPVEGSIDLEFSTFAVEGRPDLCMMVYIPGNADAAAKIQRLLVPSGEQSSMA